MANFSMENRQANASKSSLSQPNVQGAAPMFRLLRSGFLANFWLPALFIAVASSSRKNGDLSPGRLLLAPSRIEFYGRCLKISQIGHKRRITSCNNSAVNLAANDALSVTASITASITASVTLKSINGRTCKFFQSEQVIFY